MGKDNKKEILKSNKFLKIFLICLSVALVIFSIWFINYRESEKPCYDLDITFSKEDVKRIKNVEQLYEDTKVNPNFTTNMQEEIINNGDFLKIDLEGTNEDTSLLYENFLDWFSILESKDSDLYLRNQGFYIDIEEKPNLLFYITEESIYINELLFDSLSSKDASYYSKIFIDCLTSSNYNYNYFTSDTVESFFYSLAHSENDKICSIFLPLIYRDTKAKPIIYLYSDKEIDVHIGLELVSDVLTISYPKYNNGWDVKVISNKGIQDKQGRLYDYLYWESKSNDEYDLSEGFVVDREHYIEFLEEKLSKIGLSDKESNDFITYWLPYMSEYPFVFVKFATEEYENSVKLEITPTPDNILRVFVVFKGLDEYIEIKEQDLSYFNDFERKGFTVVEWGGTFIED